MTKSLIIFLICTILASLTFASFQDGMNALQSKDYKTAFNELLPEAKAGNVDAQTYLGMLYFNGLGIKQDYSQAFHWFSEAAKSSQSEFIFNNLGLMYQYGRGTSRDCKKAIHFYKLAIKQNSSSGMYNLATIYCNGIDVKPDNKLAIKLFREAAKCGNSKSQKVLGTIYYFGSLGVKKDYTKAFKWIKKAGENGLPEAQNNFRTPDLYILKAS